MSCSNAILSGRIGVSLNAYGRSRPVRTDVSQGVKRLMANMTDRKQVMMIRLDSWPHHFWHTRTIHRFFSRLNTCVLRFHLSYCTEHDVRSVQSWSLRKNYYRDATSVAVHCLAARVGDGILVDRGRALLFVRAHHAECASGFAIQQGAWSRDARIFFFNLTNCEQTAICLRDILSLVLGGSLRLEVGDILICRGALLS